MKKQIKISKKSEEAPKNHPRPGGIFAVEHCSEKAFAAVMLLKMFEMILVTIFGLFMGIFAPLSIFLGVEDADALAIRAAVAWLISSILYIAGFFTLMLGNSKIAMIVHTVAAVGTFIVYSAYSQMFADDPNNVGPSILYMPCLFITLLTLAIMLTINIPKWFERRMKMLNEKAPSILGDDEDNDSEKSNKKE